MLSAITQHELTEEQARLPNVAFVDHRHIILPFPVKKTRKDQNVQVLRASVPVESWWCLVSTGHLHLRHSRQESATQPLSTPVAHLQEISCHISWLHLAEGKVT